ncbi:MAG: hypothetical protein AB7K36_15765 [Chloroflexota bacterium]
MSMLLLGICLFPVGFVVWAWEQSNGFPYFRDANETFLSYTHAVALYRYSPLQTMMLTFENTQNENVIPANPYTHNPNLPRYAHYLLMLLGIQDMPTQTLIITVAGALGTMLTLRALLAAAVPAGAGVWLVLPLVFALDSMGFLTWAVNTYRVFAFLLLWGALAVVARPARWWAIAIVAFQVLQYEYAFALVVITAAVVFAVLQHGRHAWRPILWLGIGATVSVLVFGLQVVAFLGPSGAWADLTSTVDRRSGAPIPLDRLWETIESAIAQFYRWPIRELTLWSMASAPVVVLAGYLLRSRAWWSTELESRVLLAKLQLALVAGVTVSAVLVRGYFSAAYVGTFIPCLVFVLTMGVATAGLDLALLLTLPLRLIHRRLTVLVPVARAIGFGAVAWLMIQNFGRVYELFPPFTGEFVSLLQTKYRDQPFVAPGNLHQLAYALTGGSSIPSPLIVTEKELPSYERYRSADGQLYYLCVMHPGTDTHCDRAATEMTVMGHHVTDRATDYVIVELVKDPVPVAAPAPPPAATPEPQPANQRNERSRPRRNR